MRLKLPGLLLLFLAIFAAFIAVNICLPVQPNAVVEVDIPAGVSSREIAEKLQRAGVIRSALLFRVVSTLSGTAANLQSGHYRFETAANLWQVLQRMNNGDAIFYRVTIPEGLHTDDVLMLLAEKTGIKKRVWNVALHKLLGNASIEGRLLPETYTYRKPARVNEILASMVKGQDIFIKKILSEKLQSSATDLRIIASIVEKETAKDDERPWVAAVIRNRLNKHMALQMDPTVIYGLWKEDGVFSGNLHKTDMQRDTPWNTYTRKGLPPTPICNPGKASLLAAAHPAPVNYLYFVADGTGGHAFASDLKQHVRNIHRWLKIERGSRH